MSATATTSNAHRTPTRRHRLAGAALVAAAVVVGSTSVLAPAASAAPADATGCSGNVCMYLAGNAGGDIVVQGWADNQTFNGTFQVSGPDNFVQGSEHGTWYSGKRSYKSWTRGAAPTGTYCVTGNSDTGDSWTACEHLG